MTRHRWLLTSLSISTAGRVPSYFSSSCPLSSYCPPSRHPACHRAPARYPAPTHRPAILPAIELLPAILPAIAVPGLLPFASHLIVLVEVMRVEEVSSSEVGSSGKVRRGLSKLLLRSSQRRFLVDFFNLVIATEASVPVFVPVNSDRDRLRPCKGGDGA